MKQTRILSSHAYELVYKALGEYSGNYLEIGVFNGAGFYKVAIDCPNKKCYAIDPFIEDGCTMGISLVEKNQKLNSQHSSTVEHLNGVDNAELFVMTSHAFRHNLTQEQIVDMGISTILIDGDHSYECVVNDYQLALELIGTQAGGIIFDDVHWPPVLQAFNEFCEANQHRIISSNDKIQIDQAILVKLGPL